jgi:hypothetical protein
MAVILPKGSHVDVAGSPPLKYFCIKSTAISLCISTSVLLFFYTSSYLSTYPSILVTNALAQAEEAASAHCSSF